MSVAHNSFGRSAPLLGVGRLDLRGLTLLALTACGGIGQADGQIAGTVTIDGSPRSQIEVELFISSDGGGEPAQTTLTDSDGEYLFDQVITDVAVNIGLSDAARAQAASWQRVTHTLRLERADLTADFVGLTHSDVTAGLYDTGPEPQGVTVLQDAGIFGGPPGQIGFLVAYDGGVRIHFADGIERRTLDMRAPFVDVIALRVAEEPDMLIVSGDQGQAEIVYSSDDGTASSNWLESHEASDLSSPERSDSVYFQAVPEHPAVELRTLEQGASQSVWSVDLRRFSRRAKNPISVFGRVDGSFLVVDDGWPGRLWHIEPDYGLGGEVALLGPGLGRVRCATMLLSEDQLCAISSTAKSELYVVGWRRDSRSPRLLNTVDMPGPQRWVDVTGRKLGVRILTSSSDAVTVVDVDSHGVEIGRTAVPTEGCSQPKGVAFIDKDTVAVTCSGNSKLLIAVLAASGD